MKGKADFYFEKAKNWKAEFTKLRTIMLECRLVEELKWGCPCYTCENRNIVLIHGFKDYCALLFFKGVLISDPKSLLIQQTENVQTARQLRFTDADQIVKLQSVIKRFVKLAVEIENSGVKTSLKKTTAYNIPEEFKLKTSGENGRIFKEAFEALTPGRQRGYLLYFSAPKKTETRIARIEKATKQIMDGKGLND
jgi:uncharacterized protein YdeI (YjbR/CyaY-like superfamily)